MLDFILAATLALAVEGPPENPQYSCWSAFPVGTTVVTRTSTTVKGKAIPGGDTRTIRLLSKGDDRLILEETVDTEIAGEPIHGDPERVVVKRALAPGLRPEPAGSVDSQEEIEILGKTYAARRSETKGQTEAGPSATLTWISREIPGLVARAVTTVPAVGKVTTIEIIELTIP